MKVHIKKALGIVLAIVLIFATFSLVACNSSKNTSDSITVVDMEGNEVRVKKNISRVACISQSATDLMIAFGLGDKIVGTYRSFTYNPWTTELYPNAKNFKAYSYSVSAETLIKDGIELVIIQNTENAQAFRNAGIPVIAVHQYAVNQAFDDEVYDVARIIGEIFGGIAKTKADAWIQEVKDTIQEIQNAIGTINSENTVYYVNGEKSKGLYYSDGGNSMISRICDIANVQLATEKYKVVNVHQVSDEEMIALNPFAMVIGGAYQNTLIDTLKDSPVWSALNCVQQSRVYRIPVAMVGIENVCAETPVMLKYMASLFNPDYKFDIKIELKANIKKYFGYTLSDSDVENMCKALDKHGNRMV